MSKVPLIDPPIFIWEPNDLIAFDSIRDAERYLEPWNAAEGTAYDSAGRLLEFYLTKKDRKVLGMWLGVEGEVRCRSTEEAPTHQEDLRAALLNSLSAVGNAASPDTEDLEGSGHQILKGLVR